MSSLCLPQRYKAILLDMNRTFMFDADRFDSTEDFFATYCRVGGRVLLPSAVTQFVLASYAGFLRCYSTSELDDCFPTLAETVRAYSGAPEQEFRHIELVIAAHEVGTVPDWAAQTIRSLASGSQKLAVVSNVWAPSIHWHPEFVRAGIASAFRGLVFSSDLGCVKPSQQPFLEALRLVDRSPEAVLFVGDSLERDIIPAKMLGMTTCWVSPTGTSAAADFQVLSITELARD